MARNEDKKRRRDAKNAKHRRNERRREVLKILKRSPHLWRAIGESQHLIECIRSWH